MENWEHAGKFDVTLGVQFDDKLFAMQTEEHRNAHLKFRVHDGLVDIILASGGLISFHLNDWPSFFHLAKAVNRTIEFIENGSS